MDQDQHYYDNYQLYFDYSKWTAYNPNFYSALPAYQELSAQTFVDGFTIETVDLTEDENEKSPSSTTKSPYQEKNDKLLCETCKRSFILKKRLENHKVKCSAKKADHTAFNCKICDKSFKKRATLFKHTMKCHDENEVAEGKERKIEALLNSPKESIFHSVSILAQSDSFC